MLIILSSLTPFNLSFVLAFSPPHTAVSFQSGLSSQLLSAYTLMASQNEIMRNSADWGDDDDDDGGGGEWVSVANRRGSKREAISSPLSEVAEAQVIIILVGLPGKLCEKFAVSRLIISVIDSTVFCFRQWKVLVCFEVAEWKLILHPGKSRLFGE